MNRRQFLQQSTAALGAAACATLLPTVAMAIVEVPVESGLDPLVNGVWYRAWDKINPFYTYGRIESTSGPKPLSKFTSRLREFEDFNRAIGWSFDAGIIWK